MERFLTYCQGLEPHDWLAQLEELVAEKRKFLDHAKGNYLRFKTVVEALPKFSLSGSQLNDRSVGIGTPQDLGQGEEHVLRDHLTALCPWRKGPFNFFGIEVDAEWQSWMKWDRLIPHLPRLEHKRILDIGSSSGYYMFRMARHRPEAILGLEPQSSFYYQYLAVQKYLNLPNVFCLPVPYHQLPVMDRFFDLVFCMGILYHRKNPVEMLCQIHDSLGKGGWIVLENLVLDRRENLCLFPKDRYAKMRNVFFIPDLSAMESWLARAGFRNIQCVDVTVTTVDEQRKTDWIQTESLADFLDPKDPGKTIEGYPGPVRAVFMAQRRD